MRQQPAPPVCVSVCLHGEVRVAPEIRPGFAAMRVSNTNTKMDVRDSTAASANKACVPLTFALRRKPHVTRSVMQLSKWRVFLESTNMLTGAAANAVGKNETHAHVTRSSKIRGKFGGSEMRMLETGDFDFF